MKCTIQKADFADIHTDIIRSESIGNGVKKMGYKSRVDWCDSTWSPVTGCLHGCEYCYARRIAERFRPEYVSGMYGTNESEVSSRTNYELKEPMRRCRYESDGVKLLYEKTAYPFGFVPTFHRYRLEEPQRWKKPRNIFVCSMADLFGDWVPDEWIREVVAACDAAPQHRYLFLTKNPSRYKELDGIVHWPSFEEMHVEKSRPTILLGASATNDAQMKVAYDSYADWVSIEPIHEELLSEWFVSSIGGIEFSRWEWVVIGAETGNRKDKIIPQKEWIQEIADICLQEGTPVFMKESLRGLMGGDFKQEFPWEV